MSLRDTIEHVNIPKDSFVVAGSGLLEELNLRLAHDLDIVVSPDVFAELEASAEWKSDRVSQDRVCRKEDVEAWESWYGQPHGAVTERTVEIDGIRFMDITQTIDWKTALGRAKDFDDVALLERYLKNE